MGMYCLLFTSILITYEAYTQTNYTFLTCLLLICRDPTAYETSLINFKWRPFNNQKAIYLQIDKVLTMKRNLFQEEYKFWDKIYEKYYWNPEPPKKVEIKKGENKIVTNENEDKQLKIENKDNQKINKNDSKTEDKKAKIGNENKQVKEEHKNKQGK